METRPVGLPRSFPYGAPDLLSTARERMTGALVSGSAIWLVAFLLILAASALFPREITTPPIAPLPPFNLSPPPEIIRYEVPNGPPPARITPPREGEIIPTRKAVEETPQEVVALPPTVTPAVPEGAGRQGIVVPPSSGPAGEEVYPRLGDPVNVDELPEPVKIIKPDYPEIAKMAQVEGTVVVHVLVAKDGRVRDAVVNPKYSIPMLNAAALEAARAWVFKPALTNNRPVPVWVAIPMRFVLH